MAVQPRLERDDGQRPQQRAAGQPLGLPSMLNCNNVDTLLHFAGSGLGIAALPDFAVRAALAANHLQPILETHRQHQGAFRILWPSSRHLTPKLRAFIDFLATHVFPEH
ncbi:LysR substrate-binding domain-containing protein [Janthinobacterium sp. AD80]|uniref:LysR substrate-binding domain-containing protein n=1 Tax=Janthinobacterium sp. AD80 TaxID=1528773 RepID=UPI00215514F8|nr:LysR substrate-binding domain-containing protein [Janthinobacterium sp. AD80]